MKLTQELKKSITAKAIIKLGYAVPDFNALGCLLIGKGVFVYNGAVEDSATAEISRSQVWQWIRHEETLEESGEVIDMPLILGLVSDIIKELRLNQTVSLAEEPLLLTAAQVTL